MVTSRGAAFTITAQDKASKVVDTISQKFAGQTQRVGTLIRAYGALNKSMLALSVGLPVLISAMGAMAGAADAIKFVELERASRRSRIQLQLMGLTATDAASSVGILTEALDRGTATTFLQSSKAVASIAVAGTELTREMALAAERMSTIMGVDFVKAFDALFAARVLDDPEPLQQLIGGLEDLGLAVDGIDPNDAQGLANALIALVDKENITQAEGLAAALSRIGELTAPGRQAVEEFIAGFRNIIVTTLAERLEAQQENFKTTIKAGLAAAFIFAGRGLGQSLAVGILGGMAAMVLTDLGVTFRDVTENKLVYMTIGLGAAILGLSTGKYFLSGILALVALEFGPGIAEVFDKLESSVKWGIIVGGVVTAIALAMKLKLKVALGLGVLLGEMAYDLESGKDKQAIVMEAGFILLGGALGALLGRNAQTAFLGAFLGKTLFDALEDQNPFELIGQGWANAFIFVFQEIKIGWTNTVNFMIDKLNVVIDSLNAIPKFFGSAGIDRIEHLAPPSEAEFFGPFANRRQRPGESDIDYRARMKRQDEIQRRLDEHDRNRGKRRQERQSFFPDVDDALIPMPEIGQSMDQQGNIVVSPGFAGAGRIITPARQQQSRQRKRRNAAGDILLDFDDGASFQQQSFRGSSLPVRPGGAGGNAPIVVQLMLDKRVLGEVAIDAVNRQVRFRSGVVQGAAGV